MKSRFYIDFDIFFVIFINKSSVNPKYKRINIHRLLSIEVKIFLKNIFINWNRIEMVIYRSIVFFRRHSIEILPKDLLLELKLEFSSRFMSTQRCKHFLLHQSNISRINKVFSMKKKFYFP